MEELRELTLADVKQTYEKFLKPTSPGVRRLAFHVVGKPHMKELDSNEASLGSLKPEISDFRAMEHFPPILGQLPAVAQE